MTEKANSLTQYSCTSLTDPCLTSSGIRPAVLYLNDGLSCTSRSRTKIEHVCRDQGITRHFSFNANMCKVGYTKNLGENLHLGKSTQITKKHSY